MDGYVKLWRRLLESVEWQTMTDGQVRVLITLLLLADWEDQPGRVEIGVTELQRKANVGHRNTVRNAIRRMEQTGFLLGRATVGPNLGPNSGPNSKHVFLINNWEKYQANTSPGPNLGPNPGPVPGQNKGSVYIGRRKKVKEDTTCSSSFELTHPETPPPKQQRTPSTDVKECLDNYVQAMSDKHGVTPTTTQVDYTTVRDLIRRHGKEKVASWCQQYPGLNDNWLKSAGYPLRLLERNATRCEMGGGRQICSDPDDPRWKVPY